MILDDDACGGGGAVGSFCNIALELIEQVSYAQESRSIDQ